VHDLLRYRRPPSFAFTDDRVPSLRNGLDGKNVNLYCCADGLNYMSDRGLSAAFSQDPGDLLL